MSEKKHQFFKKITRAASEFLILAILAEKGETHPYEVLESVQKLVLQKRHTEVERITNFIEVIEKIIDLYSHSDKPSRDDINELNKKLHSPVFKYLSKIFSQKIENNKDLLSDLEQLKEEGKRILSYKGFELKVWDHVPSIYQVMEDLEKRGLIEASRIETFKGRTRKLYKITDNGRNEAINMLTIFGNLNQVIIPKALVFQNNFNVLFQSHLDISFQLIEKLLPTKTIGEIFKDIESSYPRAEEAFEGLFPIIDNDLLLISLLLEDFISEESIKIKELAPMQQELFKILLIKRLKKYREKIDFVIKSLE